MAARAWCQLLASMGREERLQYLKRRALFKREVELLEEEMQGAKTFEVLKVLRPQVRGDP